MTRPSLSTCLGLPSGMKWKRQRQGKVELMGWKQQ